MPATNPIAVHPQRRFRHQDLSHLPQSRKDKGPHQEEIGGDHKLPPGNPNLIMMAQSMLRVSVPHPGGVALIPPLSPQLHLFRGRSEKNREEFYEGRSKPVSHRDGVPRSKEREERYPKPKDEERGDEAPRGGRGHQIMDEELPRTRVRDEEPGRGRKP